MSQRSVRDASTRSRQRPGTRPATNSPPPNVSLIAIAAAWTLVAWISGGPLSTTTAVADDFPSELVDFVPGESNPIFQAQGAGHWDAKIRERGWILRENDGYHMWFTGYDDGPLALGYATSPDGLSWTRHPENPLYSDQWTEDMMVVRHEDTYYMFAEGLNDRAHLLSSQDRIHWTEHGKLELRLASGEPFPDVAFGTPTAWFENGKWYLLYERNNDEAIWLATSPDLKVWTNVQDEPVMRPGPGEYDRKYVAVNQILRYRDRYYIYYHGLGDSGNNWTTNVAMSTDLLNWEKYPQNPILPTDANKSSGILVHDGQQFRLYTMHDEVHIHYSRVPSSTDQPTARPHRILFEAYENVKRRARQRFISTGSLTVSLPWLADDLDEIEEIFGGQDPFIYGIDPNRKILETMIDYSVQQGLATRKVELEELFAEECFGTLESKPHPGFSQN